MIVVHCDRCGKIIPNMGWFLSETPKFQIVRRGNGSHLSDDSKIDICHECEKEFGKWLEMEVEK